MWGIPTVLARLATNAAALAIGGVVAQVAFISVEIVIARELGAADYGVFATIQAFALANLIILDLGMTWWAIESGSRKPETIAELLGTTMVLKLLGFAVLYPLASLGLLLLGYDERTIEFFLIFFLYSLMMAMQDSLSAVYTARQRMVVNALYQGGAALVIAVLVVAAIVLGAGLNGVGFGYLAGGLLVTLVWAAQTSRTEKPRVRLAATREILRGSYLYGFTGLLVHIFRRGDILLLSVLTSMPQVGIYAAGSKLLDLAYKVPMVGALVVSPTMFQQSQTNDVLYRRSADLFVRVNTAAGLLLALTCYHGAQWLIRLIFGTGYGQAAIVLQVLSTSFVLKFLSYALQTVLTTRGQHAFRTSVLAISTAVAAVAYCVLIPLYGAVGAAISVVLAETVLVILYLRGIADSLLRLELAKRSIAAAVAFGAGVLIPVILGITGPLGSMLGVVACFVALFLTRYTTMSELALIGRRRAA